MGKRRDDGLAIRAADLSISAPGGIRIVDGLTFALEPSRTLLLAGPTGSGKSSAAAVLAGQARGTLSITGGDAWVSGTSARHAGAKERRQWQYSTGFLPQSAGAVLAARMTVGETISEPITSRSRKLNQKALAIRIASLLDEMHLPLGAAEKYPYELSAGMLQRVALAHALVLDPKVLIADDPMANLDVESRLVVNNAIRRRQQEWGMAALIVSNEPALARELDADAIVLHRGVMTAIGDHSVMPVVAGFTQ